MIAINLIRQNGGIIAGQKKTIDIWTHGEIVTITDKGEIESIEKWIREATKWANGKTEAINDYVSYMLDQYGIL